jgi:hypothetical protein
MGLFARGGRGSEAFIPVVADGLHCKEIIILRIIATHPDKKNAGQE